MYRRRSIRLQDYDYRESGAYFVTICAYQKEYIFGDVVDDAMVLNGCGEIVQMCWDAIPKHYPMVELDAFVIMPNHIHGIIVIRDDTVGAQYIAPLQVLPQPKHGITPNNVTPNSLGSIVRSFKAAVTRHINRLNDTPASTIWQRNYYEHIIRNEKSLNDIRLYIENNPAKWTEDSLFNSTN